MSAVRTSGSITAASDAVAFGPDGPCRITITGTWAGTLVVRHTTDGSTYDTVSESYTSNQPALYVPSERGIGTYQVYASAWTSGTAAVVWCPV